MGNLINFQSGYHVKAALKVYDLINFRVAARVVAALKSPLLGKGIKLVLNLINL